MTVLALDLGQKMGWFLGNAVGPCEWGTFELENTTDLRRWLKSSDEFFTTMLPRCDVLAMEKPNTAGDSAYFAIRKLMALLGHAYYWSGFYPRVQLINEISVMTGKLTLAGTGRADKAQMIAAAAEWGCEGMNEHEADALGIFHVQVFGRREPIRKARSKSSKPVVVKS